MDGNGGGADFDPGEIPKVSNTEDFLTKQVHNMKEETTSRSKFYEQLETTLFDLERTNTQLTRKHETDMKRIQSLCENIDYLERKCEEMTGTLESMRGDSKKSARANGMSRNSYLSYSPSDSSEDDSFYMSRRRSHSLQDLRDYSSSPDELDSHNSSNSPAPDLKGSEHEFIESLENKIEELLTAKKKESEKMGDLENKMRVLITENDNLQEKLNEVQNEKDSQIRDLQRQLLDCSNYVQLPTTSQSQSERKSVSTPASLTMSEDIDTHDSPQSLVFGFANSETSGVSSDEGSVDRSSSKSPYAICKRCSTEIKVRNLVNSIEEEDSGEFSSLEHELARATAGETLEEEMAGNVWDTSFQALTTRLVDVEVQTEEDVSKPNDKETNDREVAVKQKQPVFVDYEFQDALEEEVGEEATEVPVDSVTRRRSLPAKLEHGKKRVKKVKKKDSKKNEALIRRQESVAFEEEPAELDFNYPVTKKTGVLWWLAWCIFRVLGVIEVIWGMVAMLMLVVTAAVLPRKCSPAIISLSTTRVVRPFRIFSTTTIQRPS